MTAYTGVKLLDLAQAMPAQSHVVQFSWARTYARSAIAS